MNKDTLKDYLDHKQFCHFRMDLNDPRCVNEKPCNCGLNDILRELEVADSPDMDGPSLTGIDIEQEALKWMDVNMEMLWKRNASDCLAAFARFILSIKDGKGGGDAVQSDGPRSAAVPSESDRPAAAPPIAIAPPHELIIEADILRRELHRMACEHSDDAAHIAVVNYDNERSAHPIANAWIPVSERLPDFGVKVLVYRPDATKTGDPPFTVDEVAYTTSSHISPQGVAHSFDRWCHPTHWMPLPSPPSQAPTS